jgi:transcription initiation factor TFIIH subunit 1
LLFSFPDLQQARAGAAKASVQIVLPSKDGSTIGHIFYFISSDPWSDLTLILDPLKEVVAAKLAAANALLINPKTNAEPAPAAANDGTSDASLLNNRELHKTILASNPSLTDLFQDAIKDAPDKAAFYNKFWAARIDLLRAHEIAGHQHQGESNVLSEVKTSVGKDGKTGLKMSREQIRVIFEQHPFVLRVYNDLVPKQYTESEFWANFWVSHLVKKLKGEKVTDHDPEVPKIDKYAVNFDEKDDRTKQFFVESVPRFMDLAGNEQNHSQQKGNAPDWTMRPNFHGKVQLLHVLNNMSERLMYKVSPSDAEAHGPVGMDEETFNELQLRDLERVDKDNRVMLKVNSQKHHAVEDINGSATTRKHDSVNALRAMQANMRTESQLPTELEEDDEIQAHHATKNILKTVKLRVSSTSPGSSLEPKLPQKLLESVKMTHSTTIEFLRYFWSVYLSGDDRKANELSQWVQAVTRSLERIEQVAAEAEERKTAETEAKQKEFENYKRQGGKRRKIDLSGVSGGRKAVEDMMAPTTRAVKFASGDYARNLSAQLAQQGLAVS